MKNVFLIFIFSLSFFKGQTVTIDIRDSELNQPDGYYSKDISNLLDSFVGTYLYTNGNTSLKIVLEKKVKQYNGRYYEDLIIGEYQYIVNGVEKINTLSQLNTVYSNQNRHKISGNHIITNNNTRLWKCPQCAPNEKRLGLGILDAATQRSAMIFMRRTTINGQQVMQVKIGNVNSVTWTSGQPEPLEFSLPKGEFMMIKQ